LKKLNAKKKLFIKNSNNIYLRHLMSKVILFKIKHFTLKDGSSTGAGMNK